MQNWDLSLSEMKILKFRGDHIFSIFCSNFVATLQNFESKGDFLIIFRDTENTDNKEICVIPSIDASSSPALGTKYPFLFPFQVSPQTSRRFQ